MTSFCAIQSLSMPMSVSKSEPILGVSIDDLVHYVMFRIIFENMLIKQNSGKKTAKIM